VANPSTTPAERAQQQLNLFLDPSKERDVLRRLQRVMAAFGQVLAEAIDARTVVVQMRVDHIANVNNLQTLINNALAGSPNTEDARSSFNLKATDGTSLWSQDDADALVARFTAEGVDAVTFKVTPDSSGKVTISTSRFQLEQATGTLRLASDDLSSTNQQDNVFLQSLTSKMNGNLEAASNYDKQVKSLGEVIVGNMAR
jgi:hypothetical protein